MSAAVRVVPPPFRATSVADVLGSARSGYVAASTFSGCGGSSLGHRAAGFEVRYASEFVPAAAETYRANFPGAFVDDRDVRKVLPEDVLRACRVAEGGLDLLDGSPPCASFSTAGSRERGWGKVKAYSDVRQRVDDLFFEFVRIVRGVRPRAFLAENVSGLTIGKATGVLAEVLRELRASGYRVVARVLDAQWLGVAQQRRRLILVGVREDLGVDPAHPSPLPWRRTLADVCPWLATPEGSAAPPPGFEVDPEAEVARFAIGREMAKLRPGAKSGRYLSLLRAHPDLPSPTLTQAAGLPNAAAVVPPFGLRKFSTGEARRVCGFPDDFVLTGDYRRRIERLGRAVPPPMMMRASGTIRDLLLRADGRPPWSEPEPLP